VSREPALARVAVDDAQELAARAKAILARVEWPGKPGTITVVPLTAVEQARFDRGRVVYENLCVSCHQPNGQGREKLAPTLVGSEMAQAVAEIPVRILLNGKEGQVGLMPPLGSVLSDEQIAEVMTYVRRSWGNGAAPIDAPDVARIRPLTTDRTRPWTDAELARLAGGR
jgi:mono/diheme cytochrome c family protein